MDADSDGPEATEDIELWLTLALDAADEPGEAEDSEEATDNDV